MSVDRELEQLKGWSEAEVRQYLAAKVRKMRRDKKLSQEAFAERIGVALRTYKRFESHGNGTLETFVKALKGIDRVHYLFMLFPQEAVKTKARFVQVLDRHTVDLPPQLRTPPGT
ncbi:XRE family transcriptional regulator [Cupriavidus necator]|uniref:XRE family transcriptional regulator n=1 Tax=Cupriavidus necator TaxID=106590 RepID=A0A1U9UKG2_CUPNE|nr:helix-turn-helix transcriptional regulator [Cupriavidus necator]AQV93194.1 XRE family transcriptional regulator [Cupriavidus necator]